VNQAVAGAVKFGATLARLRTACYVSVIVCWLLGRLPGFELAQTALSLATIAAILLSLPALSGVPAFLCLTLLSSGAAMLWAAAVSPQIWLQSFGQMAHLVALFSLVPLLALPVHLGGYGHAMSTLLAGRVSGMGALNRLVSLLAYGCGAFMTMATIPIMFSSLKPVLAELPPDERARFVTVSITSSHVLAMLWSPVSGVLAAILTGLKLGWFAVVGVMLPLSVLALLAQWLLFAGGDRQAQLHLPPPASTPSSPELALARRKLYQFIAVILALVAITVGLEQGLHLGLVTAVVLALIPFTLIWAVAIGRGREFLPSALTDLGQRLPRMAEMFAMFLAGGFFASALHASGYVHQVNEAMLSFDHMVGSTGFLLALPFVALAAALVGMHPLVAIAVLAESLRPELLGIPAPHLAIALTGGALLTYMCGPFGGTVGLVSSYAGVPAWRVAAWNLPYALVYLALLLLTLAWL
jgi:hypothetical protein